MPPTLPIELQTIIVQNVSDPDDLHRLTQTSRDLNFLAFEELCSIYHVHPHGGILHLNNDTIPLLSSLAISLSMVGETLHFLSCDLTTQSPKDLLKQTHSLLNFVKILSSVQRASFYSINSGSKEWEGTMTAVYNTLAEKSCTDLHIKTLARSTAAPSRNDGLTALLQKFSVPSVGQNRNSRSVKPTNELENCYFTTLPSFLQPLLLYRLNTSSQLTTLTFCHIHNYQEWDDFLHHLYLPCLRTLTISRCIIPGKAFSTFLGNHPEITFLDFQPNTFLRHDPPILPPGILPRLTKLHTSSEYLIRHFPSLDNFPDLTTIMLPAGDMARDSAKAKLALKALLPCVNDITLSLEFTYVHCLDHWLGENLLRAQNLQYASRFSETDPTRDLSCIKALKLDSKVLAFSSDGVVDLLVQWLCMFPALARVFITRPCLPAIFTRDCFETFAKSIAKESATMRNISVEGDDLSVWTWCC